MDKATRSSKRSKKGIRYWLRVVHRDLGYLLVGISVIYGVSGILLNHLGESDPAFKKEEKVIKISKALSHEQLKDYWNAQADLPKLTKSLTVDEAHLKLFVKGGIGIYNQRTGVVNYATYKKRPFVYWINKLHYNTVNGWSYMADFFAGSLIFLALSGLFILKGKKGLSGRGKWLLLIGILIPIVYIVVHR